MNRNPFKLTKEQKRNQRFLFLELILIMGAIFFSWGIIDIVPEHVDPSWFAPLGFVLILIAILEFHNI